MNATDKDVVIVLPWSASCHSPETISATGLCVWRDTHGGDHGYGNRPAARWSVQVTHSARTSVYATCDSCLDRIGVLYSRVPDLVARVTAARRM